MSGENSRRSEFWSFSAKDVASLIVYGGMLLVFLVKSDYRINTLEKFVELQQRLNKEVTTHLINSDKYNSAVTGLDFESGKPVNFNGSFRNLNTHPLPEK